MRNHKEQVDQVAALMEEFKLLEASLNLDGFEVTFRRHAKPAPHIRSSEPHEHHQVEEFEDQESDTSASEEPPKGQPVASPMAGIFYLTSSPSSPAFVKLGDIVSVGQTVGLIEAMKVYNEIPSPLAGVVLEIAVENGGLVQPGDVLLRIG